MQTIHDYYRQRVKQADKQRNVDDAVHYQLLLDEEYYPDHVVPRFLSRLDDRWRLSICKMVRIDLKGKKWRTVLSDSAVAQLSAKATWS